MDEEKVVSQEELDSEYSWMEARGKHSYNHKMINRRMFWKKAVLIALIVFVTISVFATIFVLIYERYADKESIRTKVGDFVIKSEMDNSLYLTNDLEDPNTYDILLGSGRTGSIKSGNGEETSLLATAGIGKGYIVNEFIQLCNQEIVKVKDGSESQDEGYKHYFDEANKSYILFYNSYYCNRFYLVNPTDTAQKYKLNIDFLKNKTNCYSSARLILAINDGANIKYYAFAQVGEGNLDEAVSYSRPMSTANGYQVNYLLNPNIYDNSDPDNIKDYRSGVTEATKYDIKTGLSVAPQDTWFCTSMTEETDQAISYLSEEFEIKPNSNLEFTMLLYFEASDNEHTSDIANGSMGFELIFK